MGLANKWRDSGPYWKNTRHRVRKGAVQKLPFSVIPAKVGIHKWLFLLDARFRGHDDFGAILLFLDGPEMTILLQPAGRAE